MVYKHTIDQTLNSTKDTPYLKVSYGMSIMSIYEKIDFMITGLQCVSKSCFETYHVCPFRVENHIKPSQSITVKSLILATS